MRHRLSWPALPPGTGQHFYPAPHPLPGFRDLCWGKELVWIDSVDGIHGTLEILFVAEGDGGVDAHPPFESGVGRGPLFFSGRHSLGRLEGLAGPARERL